MLKAAKIAKSHPIQHFSTVVEHTFMYWWGEKEGKGLERLPFSQKFKASYELVRVNQLPIHGEKSVGL